MTCSARCLRWSVVTIVAIITVLRIWAQTPEIASSPYVAADLHPGESGFVLTLYPLVGPQMTIPVPDLPKTFNVIGYSSDGGAIYIQTKDSHGLPDGITRVELGPMRLVTVRGSLGLGDVWYLTDSQPKIFGSGAFDGHCGAFEIDPSSGSFRALRIWPYPNCGGMVGLAGPVSTDGRRVLSHQGSELRVLNLGSGVAYSLGTGLSEGSWSPDGRWIAAWGAGRIVVIDSDNPSHRRNLGKCCDGGAHWSPDSKYLLLSKLELRCTLSLYFASLEVLEVETGKRTVIQSSRCKTGGWVGWIDRDAVR
jgi:hypothetical protein